MRYRSHSFPQAGLLAVLLALPLPATTQTTAVPAEAAAAPEAVPTDIPVDHSAARFEFIPLRHVFFVHDQAQLDDQARAILDDAALYLKHATGVDRVIIQGHADDTAGVAYNDTLSDHRAVAARDYLLAQGVAAGLLHLGGRGEHTPIDENWTREGRARNRRVEIYVVRHAEQP